MLLRPPRSPLFPYTTLFRSDVSYDGSVAQLYMDGQVMGGGALSVNTVVPGTGLQLGAGVGDYDEFAAYAAARNEHTSELQSQFGVVCPLKLEKTKTTATDSKALRANSPEVYLR